MRHTSSEMLEFPQLKTLLARFVSSPLGRAELEKIEPISDRKTLEDALAELTEAVEFHRLVERLPLGGTVDPTIAVQKLSSEGAGLGGKEIAVLITFLDRTTDIRNSLLAEERRFPILAKRGESLGDFRSVLRDVTGKILPNGLLADTASVALNRLRREMEKQRRHIHESLERFLRSHREEGVLQEEYVTLRNDRFAVPGIAGQRRKIDGRIHGASGCGQTLFLVTMQTS